MTTLELRLFQQAISQLNELRVENIRLQALLAHLGVDIDELVDEEFDSRVEVGNNYVLSKRTPHPLFGHPQLAFLVLGYIPARELCISFPRVSLGMATVLDDYIAGVLQEQIWKWCWDATHQSPVNDDDPTSDVPPVEDMDFHSFEDYAAYVNSRQSILDPRDPNEELFMAFLLHVQTRWSPAEKARLFGNVKEGLMERFSKVVSSCAHLHANSGNTTISIAVPMPADIPIMELTNTVHLSFRQPISLSLQTERIQANTTRKKCLCFILDTKMIDSRYSNAGMGVNMHDQYISPHRLPQDCTRMQLVARAPPTRFTIPCMTFSSLVELDLSTVVGIEVLESDVLFRMGSLKKLTLFSCSQLREVWGVFVSVCDALEVIRLAPCDAEDDASKGTLMFKNHKGAELLPCLSGLQRLRTVDLSFLKNAVNLPTNFLSEAKQLEVLDLTPLSQVETIDAGFLRMVGVPWIDFTPLRSLRCIGRQALEFTRHLTDICIHSLPELQRIEAEFASRTLAVKVELVDLPKLEQIGNKFLGSSEVRCVRLQRLPSLKNIGCAFATHCESLNELSVEDVPNLVDVGNGFCAGCRSLTQVGWEPLPKSISFGSGRFLNCPEGKDIQRILRRTQVSFAVDGDGDEADFWTQERPQHRIRAPNIRPEHFHARRYF